MFFDSSILIPVVVGAVALVLVLALVSRGYVKAPTDKAFIISGLRKQPRVVIGRATIKVPFLERKDELALQLIQIDVKTASTVPTADYINVRVDSNVNVKVGSSDDLIKLSSQNFLGKDTNYIASIAREVLEGNVREIVGTMKLEDMVKDRKKFAEAVKENAEPDLNAMGLELISFNVQNFIDDNKVIENLGIDNIVTIQKNAEIAKANSEKEIARAKSKADKEANDARVTAEQDIAIKNNELALKQSELKIKEDEKKAEADAVYKITEEVQRKRLETTRADADIEKQEKAIAIREKEALVKERVLEAEIKKQAEADKYKRMQEADAEAYEKQKEADVEQYKAKKEYEILKDKAEAELVAEQKKAEGISAVGKADAEAIKAKLLAEAEGLDKKADAMNKMQQAAVIEMVVEKLPEIVKNAASPLANVDSITMYGEGNGAKMVGDIMTTTDKVIKGLEGAVGLDIKALISGALGSTLVANKNNCTTVDAKSLESKED
ncbi:flotillin family protein [[Clostridium] dakarense]|uniref:flotillin family protein n=1 Tax=Faecalimicrobium dakarense TaxID=1301100 RepID=UPI0004B9DB6D|nr:flotillin family protein [[Clostridium] dakarense]